MTNNNFNSPVNGSFLGLLIEIMQAQQLSVPHIAYQFHGPHHSFGPNQTQLSQILFVNQTPFMGQGHQFGPVQEGVVLQ